MYHWNGYKREARPGNETISPAFFSKSAPVTSSDTSTLSPDRATNTTGPAVPAIYRTPHKSQRNAVLHSLSQKSMVNLFRGYSQTLKLALLSKPDDICNSAEVVWKRIWMKLVAWEYSQQFILPWCMAEAMGWWSRYVSHLVYIISYDSTNHNLHRAKLAASKCLCLQLFFHLKQASRIYV